jgi:proteasome assembly chaperone (PAC2) family protein
VSEIMRLHVRPELHEPAMILAFEGWNDAGEAATSALRFVSEAIQSVPLADMDPEPFYDFTVRRPHIAHDAHQERCIAWPANHFRYGSVDGARELVTGVGIEPHMRWRSFSDEIVTLALDLGVRRVVLLGAYLAEVVYSQPVALTGYGSDPARLAELGVAETGYEGPTGIIGVLADQFQREGIWNVSLWAGLPHYIESAPNPRGALALVQKLTECLGFRIDAGPLRAKAAEFEQHISKVVAGDTELADYVRRLKRREFAQ